MLWQKDIYTRSVSLKCAAIRHGQAYKSVALAAYKCATTNSIIHCGIFVRLAHPYLASSPDRLLVEVKCPYVARDKPVTVGNIPYLCNVEGELSLSQSHDYTTIKINSRTIVLCKYATLYTKNGRWQYSNQEARLCCVGGWRALRHARTVQSLVRASFGPSVALHTRH